MLTLVIQAGGESRRMGEDKGLLSFNGVPLVSRIHRRLETLADEVLLISNQPEAYLAFDLPVAGDVRPDSGALGGLLTALTLAKTPLVAMVACDMPFANPHIFETCRSILEADSGVDAVIPISPDRGYFEVLHAVFRRETCLPAVEAALDAGRRKLIAWLRDVNVTYLEPAEVQRLDPQGLAFWNLNTPEDLSQAEQISRTTEETKNRPR